MLGPPEMPKQPTGGDRNFDDLAERFARNVYGGLKGRIRLAVLRRDFAQQIPMPPFIPDTGQKPLWILDAGGGQGQFCIPLTQAGHSLVLCDLSEAMLSGARAHAESLGVSERVTLVRSPIQELESHLGEPAFDLIVCHALLEWLHEPEAVLRQLVGWLTPGGYLSLSFYNLHGAIYKNLLRTNYKKVQAGDYGGFRGSLSPINPLYPETVNRWLADLPLRRLCTSGVRVFYDYILDPEARARDPDRLLELELEFSQKDPYRGLGRYQHIILQRD